MVYEVEKARSYRQKKGLFRLVFRASITLYNRTHLRPSSPGHARHLALGMDIALQTSDVLSALFDQLGMREFMPRAAVCCAWRAAAAAKLQQWTVLEYTTTIGRQGHRPGEFQGPDTVNVLPDGTLCVADTANNRLQVLTPDGAPLRVLQLDSEISQLKFHTGLAGDAEALYVVDNGSHRVRKLALSDGAPLACVGSWGSQGGQLMFPEGLALLGERVYVADGGNHRIAVFDKELSFACTFGSRGHGAGQLVNPCGLAVASEQRHLFVADSGNHRLCAAAPPCSARPAIERRSVCPICAQVHIYRRGALRAAHRLAGWRARPLPRPVRRRPRARTPVRRRVQRTTDAGSHAERRAVADHLGAGRRNARR